MWPPSQCVLAVAYIIKRPEHEVDNSLPYSAEVRRSEAIPPLPDIS
jgi:hypothetical protein